MKIVEDSKMIHFMTNIINTGACHVLMGSTDCDGTSGYRQWKLTHPDQLIEKVSGWFEDAEGPIWFEILDSPDSLHPVYDYDYNRIYNKYSLKKQGNNGNIFAEFIIENDLYNENQPCSFYIQYIEENVKAIWDDFFEDFCYSMQEKGYPIKP